MRINNTQHYQDMEVLQEECEEGKKANYLRLPFGGRSSRSCELTLADLREKGRRLGFDAKQIIHPAQISTINKAFSPSESQIERAKRVLEQYEQAVKGGKGAYGMAGLDGSKAEMIDAPMILQAERMLAKAKQFGLL